MKTLIAIFLAAGIGFGGAYLYVSNQKTAAHRKETAELKAEWETEKDKLEKEVKRARSKPVAIEQINTTNTVEVEISDRPTPAALIDKLTKIKLSTSRTARYQSAREMIHYLEMLREAGNGAVPAIQQFLALNQDVEYERDREEAERAEREQRDAERAAQRAQVQPQSQGQPREGERGRDGRGGDRGPGDNRGLGDNRGGDGRGGEQQRGIDLREVLSRFYEQQRMTPPSDFLYPPSLRLGLMSVLKAIGTSEAQQVLAQVLSSSGRGIEIAFAARALEDLSPGAYRDAALASAKDLLLNPVTVPNPSRMDRDSPGYLYGVLDMYKDTSFGTSAQSLLIGEDGRLSRSALAYINSTMKENALPLLYQAYRDPRLTNASERVALLVPSFQFAGSNPTANQMIQEIVASPDTGMLKFAAIGMLDGGDLGSLDVETPSNPQDIMARKNLLAQLQNVPNLDERLVVMIKRTEQNLQNLLEGKPKESGRPQGGGDRGGPSAFGGRGPGGGFPQGGPQSGVGGQGGFRRPQ